MVKLTIQEYEDYIKEVLDKVPFLEIKQLKIMLSKKFGINMGNAILDKILIQAQRDGYFVMSTTGYLMSKRLYFSLTGDQMDDGLVKNNLCYLGETLDIYQNNPYEVEKTIPLLQGIDRTLLEIKDAMWVYCDMMPYAKDFVVNTLPWSLCFEVETDEEQVKLAEVLVLTNRNEDARVQLLKNLVKQQKPYRRESVIRIALLENRDHSFVVPAVGFSNIVTINRDNTNCLEVLEYREGEDVWKDATL